LPVFCPLLQNFADTLHILIRCSNRPQPLRHVAPQIIHHCSRLYLQLRRMAAANIERALPTQFRVSRKSTAKGRSVPNGFGPPVVARFEQTLGWFLAQKFDSVQIEGTPADDGGCAHRIPRAGRTEFYLNTSLRCEASGCEQIHSAFTDIDAYALDQRPAMADENGCCDPKPFRLSPVLEGKKEHAVATLSGVECGAKITEVHETGSMRTTGLMTDFRLSRCCFA